MPNADDSSSLPPSGPELHRALDALVETFNEQNVRYAIIGGLAIIQHTRVRTTDDIDALLLVPQLQMPTLFGALLGRGFRFDLEPTLREFRDHGFASVRFGQVIVDLLRPVIPAYTHVLDRAVQSQIRGRAVRISSAEGLIVMKLISMRPQDEADIGDLVAAYGRTLDFDFIRAELDTFTKADDPRRSKLENWAKQASGE